MRFWLQLTIILAGFTFPAVAQIVTKSPVQVQDARIAATAAGGSIAVSMMLVNPTSRTVVLVGASAPVAGQTVLQRYVKDRNGLVQLETINSLPLPPMSETVLAPGALELQFVGLTSELVAGLETPLTLRFADGSQKVLRFRVEGGE